MFLPLENETFMNKWSCLGAAAGWAPHSLNSRSPLLGTSSTQKQEHLILFLTICLSFVKWTAPYYLRKHPNPMCLSPRLTFLLTNTTLTDEDNNDLLFNLERILLASFLMSAMRSSSSALVSEENGDRRRRKRRGEKRRPTPLYLHQFHGDRIDNDAQRWSLPVGCDNWSASAQVAAGFSWTTSIAPQLATALHDHLIQSTIKTQTAENRNQLF